MLEIRETDPVFTIFLLIPEKLLIKFICFSFLSVLLLKYEDYSGKLAEFSSSLENLFLLLLLEV